MKQPPKTYTITTAVGSTGSYTSKARAMAEATRIRKSMRDMGNQLGAKMVKVAEVQGATEMTQTTQQIQVGNQVEAGALGTDDYDTGKVLSVSGDTAEVGWDSGVRTSIAIADLRHV